jgi:hypothetical protein
MKNGIRTRQIAEHFGCVPYKYAGQNCMNAMRTISETRIRLSFGPLGDARLQHTSDHEKLHPR